LPEIHSPAQFKTALEANATVRLLLDEESSAPPVFTVVEALSSSRNTDDSIALVTGPEGGWTEEEKARLTAADWSAGSLGPTILRAETAAIAAISVVNAAWRR
jgi:16S rRNA (uracil1498-N3)-methyltransferase